MKNLIIARVIILFIVASGLVGCLTAGSIKEVKNSPHKFTKIYEGKHKELASCFMLNHTDENLLKFKGDIFSRSFVRMSSAEVSIRAITSELLNLTEIRLQDPSGYEIDLLMELVTKQNKTKVNTSSISERMLRSWGDAWNNVLNYCSNKVKSKT